MPEWSICMSRPVTSTTFRLPSFGRMKRLSAASSFLILFARFFGMAWDIMYGPPGRKP